MRHRNLLLVGLGSVLALVVIAAVLLSGSLHPAPAQAQTRTSDPQHAQQVVDRLLATINGDMASSSCDFSNLSTVYTSDATLTASGGPFVPGGPFGPGNAFGAQQFQGINAVIGAYTKLCHVIYTGDKGVAPSWTQDAGFLLSPNVLNSYEHVSIGGHLTGRCMHAFTISGDHVSSLDWSIYA